MPFVREFNCERCGAAHVIMDTSSPRNIEIECPCKPKKIDPYSFYIGYCAGKGRKAQVKTYQIDFSLPEDPIVTVCREHIENLLFD